ncbi:hypothetical protein [Paenibacillus bouchesdurhonensis]|uniref:hypothetical protein n=1 Tax=Paenibacillus bouchesdurhonensis TaxID=1870990 RepID=UPI000DA5F14B|nr:hypothetical protein [Paenibacillus bouchesdurhonensis]
MAVSAFLEVYIPSGQKQAHTVDIDGNFDAEWGVEVNAVNPHEAEIDRIRNLTITNSNFNFKSLYLNETGYFIQIKMNNTDFHVSEATPRTEFRVIHRSV